MVYCKTSLKTKWGYTRSFSNYLFYYKTIFSKGGEGDKIYIYPFPGRKLLTGMPVELGLR